MINVAPVPRDITEYSRSHWKLWVDEDGDCQKRTPGGPGCREPGGSEFQGREDLRGRDRQVVREPLRAATWMSRGSLTSTTWCR